VRDISHAVPSRSIRSLFTNVPGHIVVRSSERIDVGSQDSSLEKRKERNSTESRATSIQKKQKTSKPTKGSPKVIAAGQRSVSEFFKPPVGNEAKIQDANIAKFQVEDYISDMIESTLVRDPSQEMANQQWASIFTKKVPPLCDVHGLACIELVTKKPGPNVGRGFWICSKPVGPGYDNGKRQKWEINPEYRCNFFKWSSEVK